MMLHVLYYGLYMLGTILLVDISSSLEWGGMLHM